MSTNLFKLANAWDDSCWFKSTNNRQLSGLFSLPNACETRFLSKSLSILSNCFCKPLIVATKMSFC